MKVSVAVPVRNEEDTLPALLDSLLAQTHPPDEIVVSDGGSTDGTMAVARRYANRGVRVLELGPAYPGRGRNKAIESARNEWVAMIDAGCVADERWIESLLEPLADEAIRVVFGQLKPRLKTEWDVAQALTFLGPVNPETGCRPPSTVSSLIHHSAWRAVGGFPEDLRAAEDLLFFERLQAARIPSARSPQAIVHWSLAPTPAAVFRRLRLYSAHHLAAGLLKTWHLRVMAMDVAALFFGASALTWPPAGLLLVLGALSRLLRTVQLRRFNVEGGQAFRPDRLGRVAVLLLLADIAAWAGACDYLLGREPPR